MKLIVTCGPSYEPIDRARRLTNFSTGKLGVTLANAFTRAGHEVICLQGEGSSFTGPVRTARVARFATNDDLVRQLEEISRGETIDAIFHAAALCDYRVEHVLNGEGEIISSAKFATRDGRLHLVLAPATKVLPRMRAWFPEARIVGWKYELAGTRDDAFAKAWQQLHDCQTDACVLNGAAYGEGFAVCHAGGRAKTCFDETALCTALLGWLSCDVPGRAPKEVRTANVNPSRRAARLHPSAAQAAQRLAALENLRREHRLDYPFIVKPDVGQRGVGVKLIRTQQQARTYLEQTSAPNITLVATYPPAD